MKSPRQQQPSLETQKTSILFFCLQKGRPVTIGEVAMHLGWKVTLEEAEAILEGMVANRQLVKSKGEGAVRYDRCMQGHGPPPA